MVVGKIPPEKIITPRVEEAEDKSASETKTGTMSGERTVTFISILQDIGNQGVLKTIQSLFNYIGGLWSSTNQTKDDEYVIELKEMPGETPASQIAGQTLGIVSKPLYPLDPQKCKIYQVIDRMEAKGVLTKSQADKLNLIFEVDNNNYTFEQIQDELNVIFNGLSTFQPLKERITEFWVDLKNEPAERARAKEAAALKPTLENIIEEMRKAKVLTDANANQLLEAYAGNLTIERPMQDIRQTLDSVATKSEFRDGWKGVKEKMEIFWFERDKKKVMSISTTHQRGKVPLTPPPPPPSVSSGG